jgi:phage recombination protein Bet
MNALVPILNFSAQQLSLVRKTAAKDSNDVEFNQFIEFCRMARLNPIKRQCYLFIYNKANPTKRQPVIVTAIDGLRSIADRTGNYRPDEKAPRFTYDDKLKGELNPLGLVKAEVSVFKFAHGAWFASPGEARWEEFAPIRDKWGDGEDGKRHKTGKREIDPTKEGWTRMPHLMLAKCAEAQALRRAWPEDLGGIYGEEEVDRMKTIELTATEIADEADRTDRLDKIGGPNAIMIDWMDGEPLERVPVGQFFDQAMAFIKEHTKPGSEEASEVLKWRERNRHGLQEFWAHEKDAALALKKRLEEVEATIKAPVGAGK